jgi:hypothetical protein
LHAPPSNAPPAAGDADPAAEGAGVASRGAADADDGGGTLAAELEADAVVGSATAVATGGELCAQDTRTTDAASKRMNRTYHRLR